jgi:SAM-dependent methyltransferase
MRTRLSAVLALGLAIGLTACRSDPIAVEASRLADLFALPRGATAAEIGAGDGRLTIAFAGRVGRDVRVLSNELGRPAMAALWRAAQAAGPPNVRIVEGTATDTNLPPESCDAIFMRRTYHHFMQPEEMDASLYRSMRAGGLLAVIETYPVPMPNQRDVLPSRGGDGIRPAMLIAELSGAGFQHVRTTERWDGTLYLVVMRKPRK